MENYSKECILKAENVSIGYGAKSLAVKNVTFELSRGDFLLVLGENGSGKSTLLKGILGLVPLSSGKITYFGEDTSRKIGYLSQGADADKDFPATVFEVVISGFVGKKGLFSFINAADKRKAAEILDYLGIGKLKNKSFAALSGGERQKVLLARALVSATYCKPCREKNCKCHDETFCHTNGLIVLDEPSNGLDPVANQNLYKTLFELNREKGMTVIMVSHLVESAVKYADKILHMGTELKFFGSTSEYLASDYGKSFAVGKSGEECENE